MTKSPWEAARDSFEIESSALANALSSIEQKSFEKAVKLLAGAERIGASGCGQVWAQRVPHCCALQY